MLKAVLKAVHGACGADACADVHRGDDVCACAPAHLYPPLYQ